MDSDHLLDLAAAHIRAAAAEEGLGELASDHDVARVVAEIALSGVIVFAREQLLALGYVQLDDLGLIEVGADGNWRFTPADSLAMIDAFRSPRWPDAPSAEVARTSFFLVQAAMGLARLAARVDVGDIDSIQTESRHLSQAVGSFNESVRRYLVRHSGIAPAPEPSKGLPSFSKYTGT
jgi:hypothetical protein